MRSVPSLPARVTTKMKDAVKRVPGAQTLYFKTTGLLLPRSTEDAFRDVITGHKWGVNDSMSGGGSDLEQTRVVRERLPQLWGELGVRTVLDLPCGDFYWMQHVPLEGICYTGADILPELIERNNATYASRNISFTTLDLIEGPLPEVDLILCRDCLVHLSYRDIKRALRVLCDSGSTYLLTTTFTERERNHDIRTGQFRPINLEARPWSWPAPLTLINEDCTEGNGAYRDKSLGLWRISELRETPAAITARPFR